MRADKIKEMEIQLLYRHGILKKTEISKEEYAELNKTVPYELGYESPGYYYRYTAEHEYTPEMIAKLIEFDNNDALNKIEWYTRVIKNIVLACFIGGIIGGIILIIMNSSS